MKKLSIALLCALLLGCQGTEIPIPPIGGQTGTGEKKTGTPEPIENLGNTAVTGEEDPDVAWMREFTEKFLASLNEPCTHLSGSDECSAFFFGDLKTLEKEWKAWEAQGMNSYTSNLLTRSNTLYHSIVLDVKNYLKSEDSFSKFGNRKELPYYEFMQNGCPDEFPRGNGVEGGFLTHGISFFPLGGRWPQGGWYPYVYRAIRPLTVETPWHSEPEYWIPKNWDHNIKKKVGLNIEYHPQYHYPMRIHEVKWVDLSESEDPYIVKHGLNKPVVVHSLTKFSLEPLTTPAE